jgi:hypothetical protein
MQPLPASLPTPKPPCCNAFRPIPCCPHLPVLPLQRRFEDVVVEKRGFKWINERPDAKSENDEKWGWIGGRPGDTVVLALDSRSSSDSAGEGASIGASGWGQGGWGGGGHARMRTCMHGVVLACLSAGCLPAWPSTWCPCLAAPFHAEDLLLPVLNQRAHAILASYNHLRGPVTAPLNATAVAAGVPDAGALARCCRRHRCALA